MTEQTSPACGAASCVYWHRSFKHLWENTALYSEVAKISKTTISGTGKRTGWNESCTDEISVVSRSFLFTATADFSRPKETGNVLLACLFLSRRLSPAATLLFLLISVRCPSLTVRHRPLPLICVHVCETFTINYYYLLIRTVWYGTALPGSTASQLQGKYNRVFVVLITTNTGNTGAGQWYPSSF